MTVLFDNEIVDFCLMFFFVVKLFDTSTYITIT